MNNQQTRRALASTFVAALSAAAAGAAYAQADEVMVMPMDKRIAAQSAAMTDAEMASAKALLPKANFLPPRVFDLNSAASTARNAIPQASVAGSRGGLDAKGLAVRRVLAGAAGGATTQAAAARLVTPNAVGNGGLQFSSTRTYPSSSDTAYPTRTVGKLFFKNAAGSTYMCTGSMIKPGIVVTAGHCVHSGNGLTSGWYNSFQFIPGYRVSGGVETRPYGTWTSYASVRVATAWYSGGGGVPNLRDFAVIVFNKNASGWRAGDYTGWLGYQYPMMIGKQSTVLGYPGNLDSGTMMHRVESLVTDYGGVNNGTWGSDMEGGSSGGPVVLNFRNDYANSSTLPFENSSNRITSVVSWGYIDTSQKVQGGSQFDSVFGNMITNACTAFPWAC